MAFEIRQGVERETLRTDATGKASSQRHSHQLGCKLTHPFITTDYSENLLEFITEVMSTTPDLINKLREYHAFTFAHMPEEICWPFSMPSILPADEEQITLADFGESNVGKLKTLYRKGLGYRYCLSMQSISGFHYNFSLSDNFWDLVQQQEGLEENLQVTKNRYYFGLIRNFQRNRWILKYLFGASPVVHESFLKGKDHRLESLNDTDYFSPEATSLRMGGLGYTSHAQKDISICYNKLPSYIKAIEQARLTPFADYQEIGLRSGQEYLQLNTNILQIDNEFYSTIRPKNVAQSRESALQALHARGVEYLEVRLLDNDPFHPVGLSEDTIAFLQIFLLWCLTEDSPQIETKECQEADYNFHLAVTQGRNTSLKMSEQGREEPIKDLLVKKLNSMSHLVRALAKIDKIYEESYECQLEKVADVNKTPSAKILNEVGKRGFVNLGLSLGERYRYQITQSRFSFYELELLSLHSWQE